MKFLVLIFVVSSGFSAEAKRLAPKSVKPVSHAGLRYEAPAWAFENKMMKHNGGYVRVVNTRNGLPICTKQVYETKYDEKLESDIQDVFITSLKIEGQDLVISAEGMPAIRKPLAGFCD